MFRHGTLLACLAAMVPLGWQFRRSEAETTWRLAPHTSPEIRDIYEERLPGLMGAMDEDTGEYERTLLDAALLGDSALEGPLAAQLSELHGLLAGGQLDRRTAGAWSARANRLARTRGWPFVVDLHVETGDDTWAWVRTWRIERTRAVTAGGTPQQALWLRRLGPRSDSDDALGMKKAGQPWAMVLLDEVEHHVAGTIWPMMHHDRGVPLRRLYRELAPELTADLLAAVPEPVVTLALACEERRPAPAEEQSCDAARSRAHAALAIHLATVVEAHEVHHAVRESPPVPPILATLMNGFPPARIRVTASELAASLAEAARGGQPRLSLVQALSVPTSRRNDPVGFVARVLRETLPGTGHDLASVLRLPREDLAARAAHTYRALFGMDVPELAQLQD